MTAKKRLQVYDIIVYPDAAEMFVGFEMRCKDYMETFIRIDVNLRRESCQLHNGSSLNLSIPKARSTAKMVFVPNPGKLYIRKRGLGSTWNESKI